ncbi:PLP-dependent transferase [Aspergillus indologenus CBS 114.80]|uniref:PLP-dependent transferase n=1 Tax=Aspergillus indologenus CBS 114.80 TaxID=1450541 RepID=A0A2V5HNS7_9EURO|nr:PLP-dependent transferase [Aspergillus indologenus CBS 114.80]
MKTGPQALGLGLGEPYPGRAHSLVVQIPTWADMVAFGQGKAAAQMNHGYPRSVVHPDIRSLGSTILAKIHHKTEDAAPCSSLLLFSGVKAALACKHYILRCMQGREQGVLEDCVRVYEVSFGSSCMCRDHHHHHHHHHDAHSVAPTLYAVLYPSAAAADAHAFWQQTGPGISSRLSQHCLRLQQQGSGPGVDALPAAASTASTMGSSLPDSHPVYAELRGRIAGYAQHSADEPAMSKPVTASDVFLYGSGMAAIYHVHQSILAWRGGMSVHAGLLYEPTLRILQTHGPGVRSYSLGTAAELDDLAAHLKQERASGSPCAVQAIWCECPSNPILQTVDLRRLRALADQHDLLVVVDDSVASFANVDLLGVADIVVSSLSKYFSGYADVMAGSAILNPQSRHHATLHSQMARTHENSLFVDDALRLERNSRDFPARMARINATTEALVRRLGPRVADPTCPLTGLLYPSRCASRGYYEGQMRWWSSSLPSAESRPHPRPGYGGVFSMEFADCGCAAAFFDHLDVYKGLSFGADVCIAAAYVQMTGQQQQQPQQQNGSSTAHETLIRFSVGLEPAEEILLRVETALEAAGRVFLAQGSRKP